MSQQANQFLAVASVAPAEPLIFRSFGAAYAEVPPMPEVAAAEQEPCDTFDLEASLRAAHAEGHREATAQAAEHFHVSVQEERNTVARCVQQFQQEKQRYFAEVESEVVKLALAIAERVLHREASMDPMLLAGAARVALEGVADRSEAVLRVAAGQEERWQQTLRHAAKDVMIEEDETVPAGECVLKTRAGTVHLGIRAQLQEIERGFFELLNRRPTLVAA